MRIGLSSVVGDGFGSGAFSFGEVQSECPPMGQSVSYSENAEYPIALGGTYFYFSATNSNIPNQQGDLSVFTDGNCGTFQEWMSIEFKSYGLTFYTDTTNPFYVQIEVPPASGNYFDNGFYYEQFKHDGFGGYYLTSSAYTWYASGGLITGFANYTEVAGSQYDNGTTTEYRHDGLGSYYVTTGGSCFVSGTVISSTTPQVEVPSGSGNYFATGISVTYYWDGSCGSYDFTSGSYHPYGTYIYNYGESAYYWDGNGGYYS